MSKLGCRCGATIRDQSDNLLYKGSILKNQDCGPVSDEVVEELASYMSAVKEGTTDAWFASRPWLRGKADSWIVRSTLVRMWIKYRVDVYECEHCGRLWVQTGVETQEFAPFVREEPGGRLLPSEHCAPPTA
jgi:hypothetical protein